ncbi:unnamed protein product [Sphagnum jensenii]|uniref:ATP synthase delta chain, chloroplastic n=1 Tax=Sphagnum jensenii TaxID=128206 RepID=A0ABP0WYN2_9BRYO
MDSAIAWRAVANSVPVVAASNSSSGARAAQQQQQRSATIVVSSSNVSSVAPGKRQFLTGSCCGSSSSYRHNAVAAAVRERLTKTGARPARRATVVMKTEGAAVGYASALADLARGKEALEAVNKDVERLAELLNNNEELYEFLVSPVVEDEKKKSILKTLAKDAGFTTDTLSFLFLLVDKKRLGLIKDITTEFETIFNEFTDTQLATVTSAVKIEKSQLSLIAKKIQSMSQAKNVRIKNVVDPSLIAGFLVKFGKDGSRFIDMSVKGQLDKLASQFESAENSGVF